jgi:ABC-type Zn uptake system ZnuABC Zn-binding protein ZnuA
MMGSRCWRAWWLFLVLVAAGACEKKAGDAPGEKARVAVSIFPLYDVARRVAGDRLDVVLVLPPGRTEHSYDPTPKEMARVAKSKLAISVGLGLDGWLEKIVQGAAGTNVTTLQLGPKVNPRKMTNEEVGFEAVEEAGHDEDEKKDAGGDQPGHKSTHGADDPHFWMDPVRMKVAVDFMVEAFIKLDPEGADGFRARSEDVKRSFDHLHKGLEAKSQGWTKHTIVTFHGSMGYFAERYGLKIAAVVEPFPGKEPTPRYIKEVLEAIERTQASALFSEPQLDKGPAQVIADQSKVPLFELDPIGGTDGVESYEKLLTRNAEVFDKALK